MTTIDEVALGKVTLEVWACDRRASMLPSSRGYDDPPNFGDVYHIGEGDYVSPATFERALPTTFERDAYVAWWGLDEGDARLDELEAAVARRDFAAAHLLATAAAAGADAECYYTELLPGDYDPAEIEGLRGSRPDLFDASGSAIILREPLDDVPGDFYAYVRSLAADIAARAASTPGTWRFFDVSDSPILTHILGAVPGPSSWTPEEALALIEADYLETLLTEPNNLVAEICSSAGFDDLAARAESCNKLHRELVSSRLDGYVPKPDYRAMLGLPPSQKAAGQGNDICRPASAHER